MTGRERLPDEDPSGEIKGLGALQAWLTSIASSRGSSREDVGRTMGTLAVVVDTDGLNYRQKPSTRGNTPLGKLGRGFKVTVLEDFGEWSKIAHPNDASLPPVYVNNRYIELEAQGLSEDFTIMSKRDERTLGSYSSRLYRMHRDQNVRNRTWDHRLIDHELLIESLLSPETQDLQVATAFSRSRADLNRERPALRALKEKFLGSSEGDIVFFDLGPGLGNVDLGIGGGKGKPATTSQDIVDRFPDIQVVALDMPSEVDIFTGKKRGVTRGRPFSMSETERNIAIGKSNFHIAAGNGLKSLKAQLEDNSTNPYPERERPAISPNTPIIIRSANSLDVYCKWNRANGKDPSLKSALAQMAKDFESNPIILLFNKEILFKEASSRQWRIVGKVSPKGFRHDDREGRRGKVSPFHLEMSAIDKETPRKWRRPQEEANQEDRYSPRIRDFQGNEGIGGRAKFAEASTPLPPGLRFASGVGPAGNIYRLRVQKDAIRSFERDLKGPAQRSGIHLHIRAGYRSFDFQEQSMRRSSEAAESPGYSEHHLGTAIDITNLTRESEGFLWLLKNGAKSGWIPSKYFSPVSTIVEPWHWRYVGREAAEQFYERWNTEISREIAFLEGLKGGGALRKNKNLARR